MPARSLEAYDFQGFWPVMHLGLLSKTPNHLSELAFASELPVTWGEHPEVRDSAKSDNLVPRGLLGPLRWAVTTVYPHDTRDTATTQRDQ